MLHICRDVDAVYFSVQNVYKMAYGDENTTFEPVNGYSKTILAGKNSQQQQRAIPLWILPFAKIDGAIDDIFYDFIKIK